MCGLVSEGEDTQASPSEFAHLSRIAQVDHVDASVAITLGATGLARARAVQVELDHLRERGRGGTIAGPLTSCGNVDLGMVDSVFICSRR